MGFISVLIVLLIVLHIIFFLCMNRRLYRQQLMQQMLEMSEKDAQNLYKRINDIYKDSQIMRHDLKHYLTVVLGLMINEEYEEAKKQIIDVIGMEFHGGYINYQSSSVVNAVLNDKRSICENQDIKMELVVSGDVPTHCEMDLAIVLSNLVDNAIEASAREKDKKIHIEMLRDKGMYTMAVRNHITNSILQNNPKLHSSKNEGKLESAHGYGLKSIRRLVKRMDGVYQYYEEHNWFVSYVSIPFCEDKVTKG